MNVLELRGVRVRVRRPEGWVELIRGIDLDLPLGRTLAIVGESGSGKSVTARAIIGLLPPLLERAGTIRIEGVDVGALTDEGRRRLRGSTVGMIFQDPLAALDPVIPIGDQVAEVFQAHGRLTRRERRAAVIDLLDRVGIPDPEVRYRHYPHQFSGGMQQRIMTAMAIALEPALLIADEPTTALDVTVQAQVLALFRDLQREASRSMVLITHDLGVVAENADAVAVMYAGRIVETADTDALFAAPAHPYTLGLIAALPRIGGPRGQLAPIPGSPPDLAELPPGCAFAPRCPFATEICRVEDPPLREIVTGRRSACHHAETVLGVGRE